MTRQPYNRPEFPEGTTIDEDGILWLPNGVDLVAPHVCQGCGGIHHQQYMAEHPAGGWWHLAFCIPPSDWQGNPAKSTTHDAEDD